MKLTQERLNKAILAESKKHNRNKLNESSVFDFVENNSFRKTLTTLVLKSVNSSEYRNLLEIYENFIQKSIISCYPKIEEIDKNKRIRYYRDIKDSIYICNDILSEAFIRELVYNDNDNDKKFIRYVSNTFEMLLNRRRIPLYLKFTDEIDTYISTLYDFIANYIFPKFSIIPEDFSESQRKSVFRYAYQDLMECISYSLMKNSEVLNKIDDLVFCTPDSNSEIE